jgi:sarcosine oxidase subunit beta
MEDVPTGHEPAVDQPVLERAFAFMGRVVPALAGAAMARTWGGIVDMSPDGLPIIDAVGPRGLALSTGASGHGLTLAPVVGEILADLALEGTTRHPIALFDPGRPALSGR